MRGQLEGRFVLRVQLREQAGFPIEVLLCRRPVAIVALGGEEQKVDAVGVRRLPGRGFSGVARLRPPGEPAGEQFYVVDTRIQQFGGGESREFRIGGHQHDGS